MTVRTPWREGARDASSPDRQERVGGWSQGTQRVAFLRLFLRTVACFFLSVFISSFTHTDRPERRHFSVTL